MAESSSARSLASSGSFSVFVLLFCSSGLTDDHQIVAAKRLLESGGLRHARCRIDLDDVRMLLDRGQLQIGEAANGQHDDQNHAKTAQNAVANARLVHRDPVRGRAETLGVECVVRRPARHAGTAPGRKNCLFDELGQYG